MVLLQWLRKLQRLIPAKRGAIFFTGATASIKGFWIIRFAMGKFAIRGASINENLVHWVFTKFYIDGVKEFDFIIPKTNL